MATESGRVATWLDETLADVATKLEQPAQSFPEVCIYFINVKSVVVHLL